MKFFINMLGIQISLSVLVRILLLQHLNKSKYIYPHDAPLGAI